MVIDEPAPCVREWRVIWMVGGVVWVLIALDRLLLITIDLVALIWTRLVHEVESFVTEEDVFIGMLVWQA